MTEATMTDTTMTETTTTAAQAAATGTAASAQHPDLIGKGRLITYAFQQGDLDSLRQQLLARAQQDEGDTNAALDLSMVLLLQGQHDTAMALQRHAVQTQPLYHMPADRQPATLRLLVLVACGDFLANTPFEFLVADSSIALDILYVGEGIPAPAQLPEHDVLLVAIGESAANRPLLDTLQAPLAQWHRPVVNRPEHVLKTSRDGLSAALQGAEGIIVPAIRRVTRTELDALASGQARPADLLPGVDYPVLVRPLDSHAGHGLEKIDQPAGLAAYLAAHDGASGATASVAAGPADGLAEAQGETAVGTAAAAPAATFYLSQFIDYRSADERYRKYRVVMVAGRPFLGHLGISPRWMVHYLNADMLENAANRAEEGAQMQGFDSGFAARHAAAFAQIHQRVGLDYFVMDCAETPAGQLLIFEGDTCGIVHAMDPEDLFPYKAPNMRRIFTAFQEMLFKSAGVGARGQ
ncbi:MULTISPECIES: RimK family alpha-L-glutamate ligase [unclassified Achromobacter]|uniref:ATP-grasp domain-containing protein n=1 Tax=unclassified Achromobacter TaxID=2626865 RepID=UPI00117806BC|nr:MULTISPECIES: RimK family alpha-L-glutamate ligase [unclassified Achromobacter]